MADAITIKALQDASVDAKSLEEVVNGDEAKQVTTRLGETYPSVKKAIKTLFENGGLPATPFNTYSDMEASELAEDSLSVVLYGSESGLYKKTNGDWVATDYTLSQKRDAIRLGNLESLLFLNNSKSILNVLDNGDNLVLGIQQDGGLRLFGLDDTLQNKLKSIDDKVDNLDASALKVMMPSGKDSLLTIVDANDVVVVDISSEGDIKSALSDKGVVNRINDLELRLNSRQSANNTGYCKDIYNKYPLSSRSQTSLNTARAKYGSLAPLPFNLLQGSDAVGANWVDSVSVDLSASSNLINMHGVDYAYRDGIGVVHPYAIEFAGQVAGFRYWMAITGYTQSDDRTENVFIYGSNDSGLKEWSLIEGFPQPFLDTPADGFMGSTSVGELHSHHSDVGICYDPTVGDIIVYWRVSLYYSEGNHYKQGVYGCRYDGKGWSEPYFILEPTEDDNALLSPAIIYNNVDDLFYMYYASGGKIHLKTSQHLLGGSWSVSKTVSINNVVNFWHIEAKWVGDKIVLLIHSDDGMSGTGVDALYFAVSSDGEHFSISADNIVSEPSSGFYKASFLPSAPIQDGNTYFNILYTTDGSTNPMFQLGVAKTNTINLGV